MSIRNKDSRWVTLAGTIGVSDTIRMIQASPSLRNSSVLFLASILPLTPLFGAYFQADDYALLSVASTTNGSALRFFLTDWLNGETGTTGLFYRPLVMLSYHLVYALVGAEPLLYRVFNILLHGFNVVLLYGILLSSGKESGWRRVSFWTAMLFAVHPRHSEVLGWISCRADLMAAFFVLSSVATMSFSIRSRFRGVLAVSVSTLLYAGGLMSKESAIPLPFFLLSFLLFRFRRRLFAEGRWLLGAVIGQSALLCAYLILRQHIVPLPPGHFGILSEPQFFSASVRSFLIWFAGFFLPFRNSTPLSGDPILLLGAIVVISASASIQCWRKGSFGKFVGLGALWFVVFYLPVARQDINTLRIAGERVLYLPSVGSALILAIWIEWALERIRAPFVIRVVKIGIVVVAAFFLFQGMLVWRTASSISKGLTEDLVRIAKESPIPRQICILSMPDSFDSAYVYRNAERHALAFVAPTMPRIPVYFVADLKLARDCPTASVRWRQGDAPNAFVLDSVNGAEIRPARYLFDRVDSYKIAVLTPRRNRGESMLPGDQVLIPIFAHPAVFVNYSDGRFTVVQRINE